MVDDLRAQHLREQFAAQIRGVLEQLDSDAGINRAVVRLESGRGILGNVCGLCGHVDYLQLSVPAGSRGELTFTWVCPNCAGIGNIVIDIRGNA